MTDHPLPFSPEDPRLSAYLLGEMDANEQAAFAAELKNHPKALAHLEELRKTSSLLQQVFERDPAPALSPAQRFAILSAAAQVQSPPSKETSIMKKSQRRGTWAIVAAVAALSVGLAVFLNRPNPSETTPESLIAQNEEADTKYFTDAASEKSPMADNSEANEIGSDSQALRGGFQYQSQVEKRPKDSKLFGQGQAGPKGQQTPKRNEAERLVGINNRLREELAQHQRVTPESPVRIRFGSVQPARPGDGQLGENIASSKDPAAKSGPGPGVLPSREGDKGGIDPAKARVANNQWALKADFGDEQAPQPGNESYEPIFENDFVRPRGEQALSTFSIDVDTASYSNMRRFLKHGQRPPADAVRIEELVNYFHYNYAPPANGEPFSVHTEVAVCPWQPKHHLVRFGLKGREITKEQRPLSNLVFLVDVSGSMSSQKKLPLVKKALTMLANEMNENDRISLVTYAGTAGVRLPSTSGEHKSDIISAIQNLSAGGSTNGEGGIHLAYTEAIRHFIEDGSNRVILCTDGDFNVGVSSDGELVALIQDKAKKSGVFLSIFGFGMGNLKDSKLEKLADKGNGHYAYIDNEREARKVFVEELTGTLYTIAKDVKIQVEFNPAHVGAYRLIGYENRVLANQDFNDDAKDAGEIGAGHTVTALYEIIPAGIVPAVAEGVDQLKYQPAQPAADANEKPSPEMLTLKLRYKKPDEDVSVKREFPVKAPGKRAAAPSPETEWQASVAAFGMVLRDSKHKGQADLRLVRELALGSRGPDPSGRRREFIDLILTAEKIAAGQPLQPAQPPLPLPAAEAQKTASVQGKYQKLLKTLAVPQDLGTYGAFHDYGYWEGTRYADQQDLPKAHWVYVYPNWYLWAETAKDGAEQ